MNRRLANEIEHGRHLLAHGAGEIWNWETPAGRVRWRRRVEMLAREIEPGGNVLELGCGTGYFTRELARTGAKITAIDLSPDLIEAARNDVTAPNVDFHIGDAHALSFSDATFDCVVGSSVLHHLEIEPAVRELYRVLKPAGWIRFTEPNMLNPQIALQKNLPALKKRLGDSPDETAFFRWQLRRRLEQAGFREVRIAPFDFLHPKTPPGWITMVEMLGHHLERMPGLREIAGSLYLRARK